MNLKSIVIQGFKSFPDKTELTFSPGITAVVGPNGSGKSNIADAIRWVLGEQSPRTLRGGRMEDVIFGGTSGRSPMGFCEVSLTVDNSDRSVDLDYSEVTVTRRYNRSGENNFYINRRPARLKDVRELFMDTGLGRDGYSMIGQGRIDEILSVKSTDRREIFDEAAGISKVRLRKEESLRRLAQAEDNLVRVRDVIAELEDRVIPLRAQAEKARRFLLLRDELRVIEVSDILDSLGELDEQIKRNDIDLANAERLLSARKSELDALYEKNAGFAERMRRQDELLEQERAGREELGRRISDVTSELAVKQANLKNAGDNREARARESAETSRRMAEIRGQLEEKDSRIAKLDSEISECGKSIESLSEDIERAGRQARGKAEKIDALRAGYAMLKDEQQKKLAQAMSIGATVKELEERGESGFWQHRDAAERLERRKAELEEISERLKEAEGRLEEIKNAVGGSDMMIGVRRQKLEKALERRRDAERALNAAEDRLNMLRGLQQDYEGFSYAVRRIMQAGKGLSGIHGPLSSLIRVDDKYAAAVETALGAAMQNIVVDDERGAKSAIGYLKANNFGRATFLPLTSIKPRWQSRRQLEGDRGFCGYADGLVQHDGKYRNIISSFLGTTAVVDNIDNAVDMGRKYRYAFRIVTLDGQLISAGGAMTGGSMAKSTGTLSRANEIERLERGLDDMRRSLEGSRSAAEKAQREVSEAEYRRRTLGDELHAAETEIAGLTSDRDHGKDDVKALEETIASFESEKSQLSGRIEGLEREKAGLEKEAAELEARAAGAMKEAEELSVESRGDDDAASGLEEKMTSARLRLGALNVERTAAEESRGMLVEMAARYEEELRRREQQARASSDEISALKEEIEAARVRVETLEKQREESGKRIDILTQERLRIDGEKARADRAIQNKNNEMLSQERERLQLETRKKTLADSHAAMLDRMWDAYELTRATAAAIYKKVTDRKQAARRISELKASIKALGSVNIDAASEFEEVNARYEFMTSQRDDLEKARDDLRQVIKRLTDNMSEAFADSFKKINESFSITFAEIFGGGKAYLELEDEKDILECGIDISVELPGKGRRAISLLSGGERAFVAIALYFAIIKVKPTPFCVMDEIDAALDEINVTRFTEYMQRLCRDTQFIVITHRRGTMEGCDILYGATMQEQGVTRLLKLDVREAETRLKMKLS